MTRDDVNMVACLDEQDQVHFRPVHIASADGALTSVADGVQVGERVLLNPPTDVAEGTKIDPIIVAAPTR
jgi:hypothetical protein